MKILITTLGTGIGSHKSDKSKIDKFRMQVMGLRDACELYSFDKVIILITNAHRELEMSIVNGILNKFPIEYRKIRNPDSIEKTLSDIMDIISELNAEDNKIYLAGKYGTKEMGIAIFLMYILLPEARYLNFEAERGETGYAEISKGASVISNSIKDLIYLSIAFFEMCRSGIVPYFSISEIGGSYGSGIERRLNFLKKLLEFYGNFLLFNFEKALRNIELIEKYYTELIDDFGVEKSHFEFTRRILREKGLKKMRLMAFHLYHSIRFKISAGMYDDALARIYRLVELIVQIRLAEIGVYVTKDITGEYSTAMDLEKMGINNWKEFVNPETGDTMIGLEKALKLLYSLNPELSKSFEGIIDIIKERNVTVLAHGIKPAGKKLVERAINKLRESGLIDDILAEKYYKNHVPCYKADKIISFVLREI